MKSVLPLLACLCCLFISACSHTGSREGHLALASLQQLASEYTGACNLAVDTSRAQYLIGYGSLMQEESRKRTSPNAGVAYAVELSGFRRGWFAKGSSVGFSTTFLGAVADKDAGFNAALFPLPFTEMAAMDQREAAYCRVEIQPAQLALTSGSQLPDGQYWMYLNTADSIALADDKKPLVQSYVDIFLGGCLELEEQYHLPGFASRCISSTSLWSPQWVNDRIYPRRPFIYQPKAGKIDKLLDSALPGLFRQIAIE